MYVLFVFLCNLFLQGVHVAGNVSAIKRSVDVFGLQSMHIIGENLNMKPGNVKVIQMSALYTSLLSISLLIGDICAMNK